jgi:tetratricopeptide (TPR) repeat protein
MHGLSLWKAGRTDDAALAMEEAARLDPDSIRSRVNLSRIRNDQADFDGALKAAHAARALDASDPSALFLEGRSLFNLGRFDEAVDALNASVAIEPDNGFAQNLLGLTHIRQGRPDEAIDPLERAALVEPEVAYIRNNLGMAFELSGRAGEAVVAYRRGSEIEPGGKAALNLARLESSVEPILTAEAGEPSNGATEDDVAVADETVEVVLAEAQDTTE